MSFVTAWVRPLRAMARQPLYPVVCRTFPRVDADGLVQVFGTEEGDPYLDVSYLDYLDYAEAGRGLDGMAAVVNHFAASVRHEEMTEVAFLEAVAGSFLDVLRVRAALGRLLTPEDDRLEFPPAAVISDQATTELVGVARGLDEAHPRAERPRAIRVQRATWIDPRVAQAEASTNDAFDAMQPEAYDRALAKGDADLGDSRTSPGTAAATRPDATRAVRLPPTARASASGRARPGEGVRRPR